MKIEKSLIIFEKVDLENDNFLMNLSVLLKEHFKKPIIPKILQFGSRIKNKLTLLSISYDYSYFYLYSNCYKKYEVNRKYRLKDFLENLEQSLNQENNSLIYDYYKCSVQSILESLNYTYEKHNSLRFESTGDYDCITFLIYPYNDFKIYVDFDIKKYIPNVYFRYCKEVYLHQDNYDSFIMSFNNEKEKIDLEITKIKESLSKLVIPEKIEIIEYY